MGASPSAAERWAWRITAAAVMGASPAAKAQERWATDIGAYVSYHFDGASRNRWGLGIEARRTYGPEYTLCPDRAAFFGGVARAAVVGWEEVRLTAGPLAGVPAVVLALSVEPSAGWRFGQSSGFIGRLGADIGFGSVASVQLARTIGQDSSFGFGGRWPAVLLPACGQAGRVLRDDDGCAALPAVHVASLATTAAGRAGQVWARRASAEWASVPAFQQLAEQLAVADAPASLVGRANAAAAEELGHACAAAAIAAELGGGAVTLAPWAVSRAPLSGEAGLVRLAVESWTDGCLAEAWAADCAAAEAQDAVPAIRHVQTQIAREEAGHAALAWDVLAWTLMRGGGAVKRALAAVAHLGLRPTEEDAPADLARFGCASSVTCQRLGARRARLARERLELLLA